jgi:hypothetical protein
MTRFGSRISGYSAHDAPPLYLILADYPALPGYLLIPIFYQTGKGMNYIYGVKSSNFIIYIYTYIVICVPSLIEIAASTYIYIMFIYIVIYVPSLVEIAPGVPELCWNIHTNIQTHIHTFLYIYINV